MNQIRVGWLQVCLAGVLWGTGGLVVTVLNDRDGLSALTVSALRMVVATGALLVFCLICGRWKSVVATVRQHPRLVFTIGALTSTYQCLYFASVLMVGVSVATVVSLGLAPTAAMAWEHGRARTLPSPRQSVVLVVALTGLVLMSSSGEARDNTSDQQLLGILLAIASGMTYAATTLLGRHLTGKVDPLALTTSATAAGALVLAPFLVAAGLSSQPVMPGSGVSLALLLYLGIATMALAYGLLYAGLRTISGSVATIVTLVEPLTAALLAVALLDEQLPLIGWLGGALILSAVAVLRAHEPQASTQS